MSLWIQDESKGLIELPDLTWGRGKGACLNCGEHRRDNTDGWCASCNGEPEGYDVERAREACAALRLQVETSPRIRAARAEAERLLSQRRKAVAGPAYLKGR